MVAGRRKHENGPEADEGHAMKKPALAVLTEADEICIHTIRALGADMPQQANSGHPGAAIACAPMAHCLFGHLMKFNSEEPKWINRDRFVLSNGHACALLYSMLHISGYDISIEDLKQFRKLHSKTPGHPECGHTPGVEVTTGPLGQGIANAVGLAIGAHHMETKYNKPGLAIFDNFVYCICGDGCLQEGISSEACSLAGHLGLGRLIVLYDSNDITIDGSTSLSFTENVLARFAAYGWHTQKVQDGDADPEAILRAIKEAKQVADKPSIIEIHTTIGWGSQKAGTEKVHGSPLGLEDLKQLKAKLNLDPEKFFQIPETAKQFYAEVATRNQQLYRAWLATYTKFGETFPKEKAEIDRMFSGEPDSNVEIALRKMAADLSEAPASTRMLSGKALNVIKDLMPEMIGGSADLMISNETHLKNESVFASKKEFGSFSNRYLHFGVREHGMAAISNGLAAYGCFRPFTATFLNFITYAWGAVRLSALSKFGCLYIATHDSIELGEDGPTHQAIEVLPLCRALPNLFCIRPADANEVAASYLLWLKHNGGPTVMCLCRGNIPPIAGSNVDAALRGGYVVADFANDGKKKVILAGSGSELHMCVAAKDLLNDYDVRIVSMLCWEAFENQPEKYKQEVLLTSEMKQGNLVCAYVEASSMFGWEKYFNVLIGMTTFGASAPRSDCWKEFGFTAENVAAKVKKAISA